MDALNRLELAEQFNRDLVRKQNDLVVRIAELQTQVRYYQERCIEAQSSNIESNTKLFAANEELFRLRKVLETLKRPISEFPDSLAYENRKSVADGCLALIEETLNPHPTAPVPSPTGGNEKDGGDLELEAALASARSIIIGVAHDARMDVQARAWLAAHPTPPVPPPTGGNTKDP